jgi:hypothetical protein
MVHILSAGAARPAAGCGDAREDGDQAAGGDHDRHEQQDRQGGRDWLGTTPCWLASSLQAQRPPVMPSGMPAVMGRVIRVIARHGSAQLRAGPSGAQAACARDLSCRICVPASAAVTAASPRASGMSALSSPVLRSIDQPGKSRPSVSMRWSAGGASTAAAAAARSCRENDPAQTKGRAEPARLRLRRRIARRGLLGAQAQLRATTRMVSREGSAGSGSCMPAARPVRR